MVYFKSGLDTTTAYHHLNDDAAWSSYVKMTNATKELSTAGSLLHGPEGCQLAGHLQVKGAQAQACTAGCSRDAAGGVNGVGVQQVL